MRLAYFFAFLILNFVTATAFASTVGSPETTVDCAVDALTKIAEDIARQSYYSLVNQQPPQRINSSYLTREGMAVFCKFESIGCEALRQDPLAEIWIPVSLYGALGSTRGGYLQAVVSFLKNDDEACRLSHVYLNEVIKPAK